MAIITFMFKGDYLVEGSSLFNKMGLVVTQQIISMKKFPVPPNSCDLSPLGYAIWDMMKNDIKNSINSLSGARSDAYDRQKIHQ